jgi:hypothetical protein
MANQRLRQITGFRYRTLNTVLQGLDTKGDYIPTYTDLQSYWTYDISDKVELGFLGLYSSKTATMWCHRTARPNWATSTKRCASPCTSKARKRPLTKPCLRRAEPERKPNKNTLLKFTGSAFNTYETEHLDILGEYPGRIGPRPRQRPVRRSGARLGVGGYLDHARNNLKPR